MKRYKKLKPNASGGLLLGKIEQPPYSEEAIKPLDKLRKFLKDNKNKK